MNDQIREFLKNNKPMPISQEEKASLMAVSKKSILIMLVFVVLMVIAWVVNDFDKGFLGFGAVVLIVIAAILFLLEIKDKIKYKSYDKIYSTYVYVESGVYVNKAYHINVCYYDFDYGMFNKTVNCNNKCENF